MAVETCPADLINAPVEKVWSLLSDPSRYDGWWDAITTRIDPPGPAAANQTIQGWTQALGKRWMVNIRVESVDAERHQIRFRSTLPLGIGAMNHISCAAIDSATCRVQFG
jgi:Polyketide cyclase / dehydrase and lipid transport